ncbi:MAG TPA: N-acetylmuramoyl-L-alanine amidase [Hyphomicrobium sp.]|nr:N-acetylmuramoyl-L-alanine amidase [Hyphomicrobium sp.]
MAHSPFRRSGVLSATTFASAAALALFANAANAAPPIRTDSTNHVPACVTPDRLMAFLAQRNTRLDPRYANIAKFYKIYGEGWHVRWDYAFFQMVIETNFLKFRRADGHRGDVSETQNNFAGIGATGNGVPGERFPDIATGVHAQIQHLVAYSGERLAQPIAKRTRNNQDDIIAKSHRLGRPVTFGDLARRWAADRQYGKSIDFIAGLYNDQYCTGEEQAAQDTTPPAPEPVRWRGLASQPSGLGGPVPERVVDPKESR